MPSDVRSFARCALLLAVGAGQIACRGHDPARREVTPGDCYVCHQADYEATSAPAHAGIFSTECTDCHLNEAWTPALPLRHDWFRLANRHAETACADCHTAGYRAGETPDECVGCHRADFDAADMPPHTDYSTSCATCHTDAGWAPSVFDHPWALTGAHELIECSSCHTGTPPAWAGIETECAGCHRDDYDASPYPNHQTFPLTCGDCHSTSAWTPASEGVHPESAFPIRGEPHDYACADCHDAARGSAVDGVNTDCVGCHDGAHTRARMDEQHREVGGYPRGTASVNFCLDCHPGGRR